MKRLLKTSKAFLGCENGLAAIELAMVAPILVFGALGMTDVGRFAYLKLSQTYAVGVGAEYVVAKYPSVNADAVSLAVNSAASVSASVSPDVHSPFTVTTSGPYPGCPTDTGVVIYQQNPPPTCAATSKAPGTYVTITATKTFTPVFTPPVVSYPASVTSQAVVRTQ